MSPSTNPHSYDAWRCTDPNEAEIDASLCDSHLGDCSVCGDWAEQEHEGILVCADCKPVAAFRFRSAEWLSINDDRSIGDLVTLPAPDSYPPQSLKGAA